MKNTALYSTRPRFDSHTADEMSATSAKRAVTWWYTSVVFGVSVADEHWQNSGFDLGLLVAMSALAFGRGDDAGCDDGVERREMG